MSKALVEGLSYLASIAKDTFSKEVSWKDREARAIKASEIDFGCQIQNGKCKGDEGIEQFCCHGCFLARGYLQAIPKAHAKEIISLYKETYGFWRPGGCVLPRKWRSDVCLHYLCDSVEGWKEKREILKKILG